MKILVSACVMGQDVRWNGANKHCEDLSVWASKHGFELIPVCPEDFLFGTPRQPIRMIYEDQKITAKMGERDVLPILSDCCEQIHKDHNDAVGFIGISGSPSCGVSVGVKNLGNFVKGQMHSHATIPSTEISQMRTEVQRDIFYKRVMKYSNCTLHEM